MSVTQYIGARYVPLFADPLTWDITKAYEPLTIVYYQGNSFTSRQAVPAGIDITNTDYWAITGNYNAQIEQYRTEVQTYDNRITANTTSNTAQDAQLAGTSSSGLKTLIDANTTSNATQDAQLAGTASSGLKTLIDANTGDIDTIQEAVETLGIKDDLIIIGDSWSTNDSAAMPTYLANMLNCTLHNFAHGAMGFIQGTDNFQAQAQRAVADTSINPDNVKYIIIIGGTNDFAHGITSGATIASAITTIVGTLKPVFKKARIHVFFDYRFSLNHGKILPQIATWNATAKNCALSNIGVVVHPESMSWLNDTYFDSDLIHLTSQGWHLWAQYVAAAVTGSDTTKYGTGYKVQQLDGAEGFSGNACMYFDEREVWIEVYLVVAADSTSVTTVKNGAEGLWPVQIFASADNAQASNKLGVPLVKTDGRGMGSMILHFQMDSSGRDSIQVAPLSGGTLTAGHYTGFARCRFFGV